MSLPDGGDKVTLKVCAARAVTTAVTGALGAGQGQWGLGCACPGFDTALSYIGRLLRLRSLGWALGARKPTAPGQCGRWAGPENRLRLTCLSSRPR
jgi:hypothetical protein